MSTVVREVIANVTIDAYPAKGGPTYEWVVQVVRTVTIDGWTTSVQVPTFVLPASLGLSTPAHVSHTIAAIVGATDRFADVTITATAVEL